MAYLVKKIKNDKQKNLKKNEEGKKEKKELNPN